MTANAETYKPSALEYREAIRVQEAITAPLERKALVWLARRTPHWIGPDHLTALGFAAQFMAGVCYVFARWSQFGLLGATTCSQCCQTVRSTSCGLRQVCDFKSSTNWVAPPPSVFLTIFQA